MRNTNQNSWIKSARKDFEAFPDDVLSARLAALTFTAQGEMSGVRTLQNESDPDREKPKCLKEALK